MHEGIGNVKAFLFIAGFFCFYKYKKRMKGIFLSTCRHFKHKSENLLNLDLFLLNSRCLTPPGVQVRPLQPPVHAGLHHSTEMYLRSCLSYHDQRFFVMK